MPCRNVVGSWLRGLDTSCQRYKRLGLNTGDPLAALQRVLPRLRRAGGLRHAHAAAYHRNHSKYPRAHSKMYEHTYDEALTLKYLQRRYLNYLSWLNWQQWPRRRKLRRGLPPCSRSFPPSMHPPVTRLRRGRPRSHQQCPAGQAHRSTDTAPGWERVGQTQWAGLSASQPSTRAAAAGPHRAPPLNPDGSADRIVA
jgi:hypothetical protein